MNMGVRYHMQSDVQKCLFTWELVPVGREKHHMNTGRRISYTPPTIAIETRQCRSKGII